MENELTPPDSTAYWRQLGGKNIGEEEAGQRVDQYLAHRFPFFSRETWKQRIQSKQVRVNENLCRSSYRLRLHDKVEFYHPPEREPEVNHNLRVIEQSNGIAAVYKPPRLPMHENGPYKTQTFAHFVQDLLGDGWAAIHRLDFETSGIVVCCKEYELRRMMSEYFAQKTILKSYLALVEGTVEKTKWTNRGPIGDLAKSRIRIKKWVMSHGQPAHTDFELVKHCEPFSLVRAFPRTGRTNQIRIHLAHAGHRIWGDKLYHPDEDVFIEYHERGPTETVIKKAGCERLCLHAESIAFAHPLDGKEVRFHCPLPNDIAQQCPDISPSF